MKTLLNAEYLLSDKERFLKLDASREDIIRQRQERLAESTSTDEDDDSDDALVEAIESIANMDENIDYLDESVKTALSNAKMKIKKIEDKIDSAAQRKVDQVMNRYKEETEDRIVRITMPKLTRMLKTATVGGIGLLVAPATTAILAIVSLAMRKKFTDKSKKRILNELKLEAEIIEEKIKDADAEGNKQAKYELMRRRADVNRAMDRIRYNIKP